MGPSSAARKALQFFISKGWTLPQAAGIVGNLQAESGKHLNHLAVGDNGEAEGLAQWHSDRRRNFEQLFGHSIADSTFDEHCSSCSGSWSTRKLAAADRIRSADNARDAAIEVDRFYGVRLAVLAASASTTHWQLLTA